MMLNFTAEQEAAITTIDKNVAVSAGAGSGKTRVLVERFLHILRQGAGNIGAGEILAITFTRKAAAEMKERIRSSMEQLVHDESGSAAFWQTQLGELDRAQITTIHSFCNRILKENPVEAGLDPAFQVAEEFEGQEFLDAALKDFIHGELRQPDNAIRLLTDAYGVKGFINQLQAVLNNAGEIAAMDLRKPYEKNIAQSAGSKAQLCSLLEELASRREEATKTQVNSLADLAENLQKVLDGIMQDESDFTMYKQCVKDLRAAGKLKSLIGDIKKLQEQVEFAEADKAALPVVEAWQKVLTEFDEFLRQRKSVADFLTFDDLETLALKLLTENERVRHFYQQKFRHIMVDEFQDTNERQKRLVYLLCGDDAVNLHGSKLFVVGDPKQSIYRFRGADVSVFAQVQQDIKSAGGRLISLADNFRTVDKILDACNDAFEQLLVQNGASSVQFEPLRANRTSEIKPLFLQVAYNKENQSSKRQLEAAQVAEKMLALHENGAAYGDMAVLLSAMTYCDVIAQSLQQRQIPFQVIDGKGFYERQEIIDLLNLFTALQNRHRSLELAGVLRSPYFGLDDETITWLFLMSQEDNVTLWDELQNWDDSFLPEEQQRLASRSAEILKDLRQCAASLALPELLEEVRQRLNIDAVLSLQQGGAAKLANAQKLWRLASEYSASHQGTEGTLAGWLEYVEQLRMQKARETAANLNASDAVTIMTIHKSKGLEFPVVFLPMLDKSNRGDISQIKFHPQIGLGVKVTLADGREAETSVYQAAGEANKEQQRAEKQRQLYVAMTRARDRLIMSGAFDSTAKTSTADTWFNNLKPIFESSDTVECSVIDDAELTALESSISAETMQVTDDIASDIAPLASYTSGSLSFTATALQTYLRCPRQYFYQQVAGLPPVDMLNGLGSGVLPAYVTGLVVHKALECYNGDEEKAFKSAADEFAGGNYAAASAAQEMLHNYLASSLYKKQPANKQRELHFNMQLEGDLELNGVIDCVTEEADGLTIIDYKTGQPPRNGEVKTGYAYQLALYKMAAEKLFKKPVAKCELHFLQNLSVWQLPDGDEYLNEAISLCRKLSAMVSEEEFACNTKACSGCPYSYMCPQK